MLAEQAVQGACLTTAQADVVSAAERAEIDEQVRRVAALVSRDRHDNARRIAALRLSPELAGLVGAGGDAGVAVLVIRVAHLVLLQVSAVVLLLPDEKNVSPEHRVYKVTNLFYVGDLRGHRI